MQKYKINLNIIAPKEINEDEICTIFENIVYFIDDKTFNKRKIWFLDFELKQEYSIEQQIEIIISHIVEVKLNSLLLKGIEIEFDIQIYYDTYTCSFGLSSKVLRIVKKMSIEIEFNFSLYPTNFSS